MIFSESLQSATDILQGITSVYMYCEERPWQGPEVMTLFFMLNSAKHEIFPANVSQITNNCKILLLNIDKHGNFSANKYENANYCWHFHIY